MIIGQYDENDEETWGADDDGTYRVGKGERRSYVGWACTMAMNVSGVNKKDLIPQINKVVTLTEYAAAVKESKVNLFIS